MQGREHLDAAMVHLCGIRGILFPEEGRCV
jgi:hypothetical protein